MAIVSSHASDDSAKPKRAKPKPTSQSAPAAAVDEAALQPLLSLVKGGEVQPEDIQPAAPQAELSATPGVLAAEDSLRPQRLHDYIGQAALKEVLNIAIKAAQSRQEPLDHLLLYGPPGLGKTTMALILAQEMGVTCKITTAPALERPRDIAGLLVNLKPGDVLFIDEIHRLPRVTEEILYPAMEDARLDITIGKGQSARTRSIPLCPFTLVGATTRVGALTSPLRDRFGLIQRLRFYEIEELTPIVLRTAEVLKTPIEPAGAAEIARRARGTPRIANRLLRRVRDYVEVKAAGPITAALAAEALELFNVDPCGLDWTDRRLLSVMVENFGGGPVGLDTMAASTGEDPQTIEEVYEPYLLQIGYLQRTPRGRVVTPAARRHLGYAAAPDDNSQMTLL
ncbi:MAG: Holliday junction branch migration DNA helicase RuvB [Leptolyngbya sp. DLM2.Bin27]|nr:MAG: Holliday junction branch migration DNA helicase RuvB [Leptolyngbya sp. DLM2.Bin27]